MMRVCVCVYMLINIYIWDVAIENYLLLGESRAHEGELSGVIKWML